MADAVEQGDGNQHGGAEEQRDDANALGDVGDRLDETDDVHGDIGRLILLAQGFQFAAQRQVIQAFAGGRILIQQPGTDQGAGHVG